MGIILAPALMFHFNMFILGFFLNAYKTSGIINRVKYIPVSLTICFISAHFFVTHLFSKNKEMTISAFQILFEITYGKYLIILIIVTPILFIVFNKKNIDLLKIITATILMFPLANVALYFIYVDKLLKAYNIRLEY